MTVFTIRIVYKSGYVMDFDCLEFTIEDNGFGGNTYKWKSAGEGPQPLLLGPNEIAAVWQVGHRTVEVTTD